MPGFRQKLIKVLVLAGFNLALIALLCAGLEIYLRLTDPFIYLPFDTSYYKSYKKYYPDLVVPASVLEDDITWGHRVSPNAFGFREREFDRPKPAGLCRIVVLGDSFTWGTGLDIDERFTQLVEDRLLEHFPRPRREFEVIALARRGWSTGQERDALRDFKDWLRPDFIVTTFVFNDPQFQSFDYTQERLDFYERYGGAIDGVTDRVVWVGLPRTAKTLHTAFDKLLVSTGVLPPWEVGTQRTYESESAEWRGFVEALQEIKKMSDEMQLPTPLFIVLNQAVFLDHPTPPTALEPSLPIYLRWYHQAEQTAARLGFRTYNHEEELIEARLAPEDIPVNVLDQHPSARVNEIYAGKLFATLAGEIEAGKLCAPSAQPTVAEASTPLAARQWSSLMLGDKLRFLGYVADLESLAQERRLRLTFGWQTLAEIETNYVFGLELAGAQGEVRLKQEELPCGGNCPTIFWPAGLIAPPGAEVIYWPDDSKAVPTRPEQLPYSGTFRDTHELELGQLPPGDYTVTLSLYDRLTGEVLPVHDEMAGNRPLPGGKIILGRISLKN